MKKIIELAKSAHEPTPADMERVFSKVIAAAAAATPPPPPPQATIAIGKSLVVAVVAAATVAVVGARRDPPLSLPHAEPPVVSTPARAVFVPEPSPRPSPPAPKQHRKDTFADELALIERARAEDPSRALATLELHQKRFAAGALSEEAEGLRVRAFCALGDRDKTTTLGRAYLAKHPRASLAETIRNCLARFP